MDLGQVKILLSSCCLPATSPPKNFTVLTKIQSFSLNKFSLDCYNLLGNSHSSEKVSFTIFFLSFSLFLWKRKFLRFWWDVTHQTGFLKSGSTMLYSHQQPIRVAMLLYPHQYLCMVSLFCFRYSNRCVVISLRF